MNNVMYLCKMILDYLFGLRLGSRVCNLDMQVVKDVVSLTHDWCVENLGTYKKKTPPKIKMFRSGTKCGTYLIESNMVYIFPEVCVDIETIIKTMVHEYCHYMDPNKSKYFSLLDKYGYDNHPSELKAREWEMRYYKQIWKEIKNKI